MDMVISLALDGVILLILILSIVIGAHRGLIKGIVGLFGNIAALVVALIFSVQLGSYLNDNYVREPLRDWVVNQLTAAPGGTETSPIDVDLDGLFENSPEFFTDLMSYLGLNQADLSTQYNEFKASGTEQAKSAILDVMVDPISAVVSRVIAFLIIYLLALLAVKILWWISDLIAKIPVIRSFDRAGGGLLGIITGIVIVFVFISIAHLTSPYLLKDKPISERISIYENTYIYKRVYEINPLSNIFGEWFSAAEPDNDKNVPSDGINSDAVASDAVESDGNDKINSDGDR